MFVAEILNVEATYADRAVTRYSVRVTRTVIGQLPSHVLIEQMGYVDDDGCQHV